MQTPNTEQVIGELHLCPFPCNSSSLLLCITSPDFHAAPSFRRNAWRCSSSGVAVPEQLQTQQRTRAHQVDPSLLLFQRPCWSLVQWTFAERWQLRNTQKRWRIFSAVSDGLSSLFLMKRKEAFNPLDQLGWQWNTVKSGWNPGLCTRKGWKSSFLSKRGEKMNGEGEY